jgi:hypothetical protein
MAVQKPLFEVAAPTFVKRDEGASHGVVGFREPLSDDKLAAIEKLQIKAGGSDEPVKWRRLTDEEEKQYHLDRATYFAGVEVSDDRDAGPGKGGGGRDRDRSDRGRGRGRGRGRDRDDRSRASLARLRTRTDVVSQTSDRATTTDLPGTTSGPRRRTSRRKAAMST